MLDILKNRDKKLEWPYQLDPDSDQATGIAGWWTGDPPGGKYLYDLAGRRNATYTGTPPTGGAWVFGKDGIGKTALNFNGSSNYCTTGLATAVSTNFLTIHARIQLGATGVTQYIVGKDDVGSNRDFALLINSSNTLQFAIWNQSATFGNILGNTILTTGVWYDLTGTWDGANCNVYVNGILDQAPVALTGTSVHNSAVNLEFGRSQNNSSFLNGVIDGITIWGAAKSEKQIRTFVNDPTTQAKMRYRPTRAVFFFGPIIKLYAKSAGGNWSAAGTWSLTGSGGADNSGPPIALNDVIFEAGSGNVTIDSGGTRVCRSLDTTSGTGNYAGTLTHNTSTTLNIGDGTPGIGNVALKFNASMTYTPTSVATIGFISTATTQQTIDSGGKALNAVVINGVGSSYQLSADISVATWTYTAGTTFSGNTKTITVTTASTFAGGGKTYYGLTMSAAGTYTITGVNTFTNLTRNGTAALTDYLLLNANQTVTGTFTLAGNSAVNRLYFGTDTRGTTRTVTNTGATQTWSNVDIEDISLTTSFNASAITGNSGDCGGNTNITFTTGATQYFVRTVDNLWESANWGTSSGGSGGRVPLPQDSVIIDSNSWSGDFQGLTCSKARMCKNLTLSYTGADVSHLLIVSPGTNPLIYGSLTLAATIPIFSYDFVLSFQGRGSFSLTSNGKTTDLTKIQVDAPGGTLTIADAAVFSETIALLQGTLTFNNINTTCTRLLVDNNQTRVLNLGTGILSLTGTGNIYEAQTTTGLTVNPSTSTIKVIDTTNVDVTFIGGGFTFNNLWFNRGASTGNIIITGSNTFNDFKDSGTIAHSIQFTAGTTTHVTTFTVSGSAGNLITVTSDTTATHSLIKDGGGTIGRDYLSIAHSVATPGSTWYAGTHSTNNQATSTAGSGWIFTDPPGGGGAASHGFFFSM